MDRHAARALLTDCYESGLAAVDPERAVATSLSPSPSGQRVVVFALGKAAPAMVRGAATALGLDKLEGVAVSNHWDEVPSGIELIEGGHPIPDERSLHAGHALLALADAVGPDDRAVVLISGGGSALAEVPVEGVTIDDLGRTTDLLLRCGAAIDQINTIRRHLSVLKGGGLAQAIAPASVETLAISDVVGDSPAVIASGPTVPELAAPSAWEVVRDLHVDDRLPESVGVALQRTPPHVEPAASGTYRIVASGAVAAHATAAAAERHGHPAAVVDTRLEGEASEVAGEVLERSGTGVAVFAGETTVTVRGSGIGGRNQEAALTAATLIAGRSDVFFLAAGTDGIDGTSSAAGAFADGTTLHRARALGLDAAVSLDNNDSGTFFSQLGDHLVVGPTGTNVGDLWIVLRTS